VVLGRIVGVYGVRGWIRIRSETEPPEGILGYSPWLVGDPAVEREVIEGRRHGKGIVAHLAGCDDRDRALSLMDQEIAVTRDRLPPPTDDEFYWTDLEGMEVWTLAEAGATPVRLGVVDHLFSTGVNDVLVVTGDRERLLPFTWDEVIRSVDFEVGRIEVDWDPDF
jgi:16S rRNA processing protein RimM